MSRRSISFPRLQGVTSRQAHADLPAGTFERELGHEGFFGPATHMYHRRPPTGWHSIEGPLRPRAFDLRRLSASAQSPWQAVQILHNAHCRLRWWRLASSMDHLVRNSDGDDLLFVHAGRGEMFCDYGHLSIEAGDYIVLPRGTMWRIETKAELLALLIEATGEHYMLPDKGLVGPHAIFDPAMLDVPAIDEAFTAQAESSGDWQVHVKRHHQTSVVSYPYNPLDAVGWKGDLAPVRINVRDLRALMSHRYHLPPSAHTTFVAGRFVVCTFTPRPFETAEDALKVPFFHNNDDYDEVLFYHAGDFFSRDHIDPGMLTFHPAGITHGPHPKALANMLKQTKPATDEYAVMIDARDGLELAQTSGPAEVTEYADSWRS